MSYPQTDNGEILGWGPISSVPLFSKFFSIANSSAPGKFWLNVRHLIFKQILVIDVWCISCEIVLIWMSLDFTDDQSTLVQVMAWCRQATSHYLNQCWLRSKPPYGVTRPQWVKTQVNYWISHSYFSSAAVTPVKWYKCDSNNLRGTFVR